MKTWKQMWYADQEKTWKLICNGHVSCINHKQLDLKKKINLSNNAGTVFFNKTLLRCL